VKKNLKNFFLLMRQVIKKKKKNETKIKKKNINYKIKILLIQK